MDPSNIWEDVKDGEFEWRDGRLTIQPVATLFEMASFKVALVLWDDSVSRSKTDTKMKNDVRCGPLSYDGHVTKYFSLSKQMAKKLNTPPFIEKVITNYVRKISNTVLNFMEFLTHDVFRRGENKLFDELANAEWFSWHSNGELDYDTTVSSILSMAELSRKQKFTMVCKFCRVEDILNFSLDSLPSSFINGITFAKDDLLYYWICYLRNELHTIPLGRLASVDALMTERCQFNVFAYEYFWDRLNSDDKINQAVYQLSNPKPYEYKFLKIFVQKMARDEQHRLFCRLPVRVVKLFWIRLQKPKCAISIWLRVRDQCTDQFNTLVRSMLHTNIVVNEEEMKLFIKLWNETPDKVKQLVAQLPVRSVTRALLRHHNLSPSSLSFFHEFLLWSGPQTRKTAMRNISRVLSTKFAHSLIMIDVIELCFPDVDERAKFQKRSLNSVATGARGLDLFINEKFDDLSLMLKIASPNVAANRELVKKLLDWNEDWLEAVIGRRDEINLEKCKFILNYDKWTEMSRFVDGSCSSDDDPMWIANTKKHFVLSFATADGFFWRIKRFDDLTKVLEDVFTPEEGENFRKTLLNTFKNEIITEIKYWKRNDEKKFVEFVSWCLGDPGKVEKFKATLPRDDILDSIFKSACHAFRTSKLFRFLNVLNKCLRLFLSVDQAKEYKLRKMNEFDNEIILGVLFQPNMAKNLKLILRHVFDNDAEEMEKWQSSKQRNTAMNIRKRPNFDDQDDDSDRDSSSSEDKDGENERFGLNLSAYYRVGYYGGGGERDEDGTNDNGDGDILWGNLWRSDPGNFWANRDNNRRVEDRDNRDDNEGRREQNHGDDDVLAHLRNFHGDYAENAVDEHEYDSYYRNQNLINIDVEDSLI